MILISFSPSLAVKNVTQKNEQNAPMAATLWSDPSAERISKREWGNGKEKVREKITPLVLLPFVSLTYISFFHARGFFFWISVARSGENTHTHI
jgi:hypothetical protein